MTACDTDTQTPFTHEPDRMPPELAIRPDPIRIYVACLAAYNSDHLHGSWIDVTNEDEIWQAVKVMLSASPIETAEEWAIHDYEGFDGAEVGEYISFANIVELADFIKERSELGAAVLNYYGGNIEDAKTRFDEYAGEYESLEDYARELTEQSGETIPERLAPYIDYKAMAHDYEQSGEFLTFEIGGSVHIFSSH